ncbi:MAG: collagenase-like protease, partial [Kiritimatiellia bacterium]
MILPELLSPVGDLASFHAALENGANAVYVGIGRFNMRRTVDGKLEISQLPGMVAEAHAQNVKVF